MTLMFVYSSISYISKCHLYVHISWMCISRSLNPIWTSLDFNLVQTSPLSSKPVHPRPSHYLHVNGSWIRETQHSTKHLISQGLLHLLLTHSLLLRPWLFHPSRCSGHKFLEVIDDFTRTLSRNLVGFTFKLYLLLPPWSKMPFSAWIIAKVSWLAAPLSPLLSSKSNLNTLTRESLCKLQSDRSLFCSNLSKTAFLHPQS